MTTLRFIAVREHGRWVLHSEALPGLELRVARLTSAPAKARAAAAELLGLAADDVVVVIAPELPSDAAWLLERARDWQDQIAELVDRAGKALAEGVQLLRADGLSRPEVAIALGITVDRVRQLEDAPIEERVPLSEAAWRNLHESGALRGDF